MRADRARRAAGGVLVGVLAALALLAGCTPGPAPSPSAGTSASASGVTPTASPTRRPFTVTTTEAPHSLDPAAAQTGVDTTVALDVFQRLLVLHSGSPEPKPDAGDCLFRQPTAYECTLTKGLTFSNGHALTASDVKFSIERAYRLNVAGTSVRLFDALQRVEVVDELTVRFVLGWPDSQFGVALATPAASIVDEQTYDPDNLRPDTSPPVGSGPFTLVSSDSTGLTFARNPAYVGATKPRTPQVRLAIVTDSAAAEQSLVDGSTDVVWRSLDAAALARLASGASKTALVRADLPAARAQRLVWTPDSPYRSRADLRTAVASALQADRTWASLVPPTVPGSTASFAVGGHVVPVAVAGPRVNLTLSYAANAPGQADLARLLRDRLEASGGMSVQLKPDATADLRLVDAGAWANTALGWLQPYVDAPLPGSQPKLATLSQTARTLTDATARQAVLAELQQQAAADATVLPISLGPETLFTAPGTTVTPEMFGPCWQLGLWGFTA